MSATICNIQLSKLCVQGRTWSDQQEHQAIQRTEPETQRIELEERPKKNTTNSITITINHHHNSFLLLSNCNNLLFDFLDRFLFLHKHHYFAIIIQLDTTRSRRSFLGRNNWVVNRNSIFRVIFSVRCRIWSR